MRFGTAITATVCALPFVASAQPITKLGAIGDSLTDEYAEQGYGSYAMSWTELLVDLRGIDMGPTASQAGVGNWGEPRRTMYEDNWARYGATTDDAINTGQHIGAAEGGTLRNVSHIVIFIGGNDFGPAHGPYADVYDGNWTQNQIDAHVGHKLANAEAIMDVAIASGAKVVIANLFDFGAMVSVERAYQDPAKRQLASAMYDEFSEHVEQMAMAREVPVLDMLALNRAIFGSHAENHEYLVIAGRNIKLNQKGTDGTPDRAFVNDGTHPRTTIQGVWCNAFIEALNLAYDTGIQPLTETEILATVGLTPSGPDALASQLGELSQYVILPPTGPGCLADTNSDGMLSPADFSAWVAAFNASAPVCDQNDDGSCTPADFSAWVANYNAGCP